MANLSHIFQVDFSYGDHPDIEKQNRKLKFKMEHMKREISISQLTQTR